MENEFYSGSPKTMFWFGFVSGIALSAVLTSFYFIRVGVPASQQAAVVPSAVAPTPSAAAPTPSAALPKVTKDEWVRGDLSKAKVVLVEYSDFECPFCGRHHPSMVQAVKEYGDDVAWVYRHFPLSFHPQAEPAALSAECVGNMNGNDAFWKFADAMYGNQTGLSTEFFEQTAQNLGVNMEEFRTCVSTKKYASKIQEQQAGGSAAGVSGTPATYVNGQLISGAVPYAQLKQVIDAAL